MHWETNPISVGNGRRSRRGCVALCDNSRFMASQKEDVRAASVAGGTLPPVEDTRRGESEPMLSSNMLLLILILLIVVTFSTPTPFIIHDPDGPEHALRMSKPEIERTTSTQPTRIIRFHVRTKKRPADGPSVSFGASRDSSLTTSGRCQVSDLSFVTSSASASVSFPQ